MMMSCLAFKAQQNKASTIGGGGEEPRGSICASKAAGIDDSNMGNSNNISWDDAGVSH